MSHLHQPADASLGPGAWPRISTFLVRWRWPLLALGLLASVAAYFPAQRLAFDRSIENMFAPDDPILEPYRQLKRTFGGNEVALAAYVDPRLLTSARMDRLDALTKELAQVPGVASAFSLSTSPLFGKYIISSPLREPFLKLSEGYTVSADGQTAGVVCVLAPEHESPISRSETVDKMRKVVIAHQPDGVLTGEPVMVVDGFRYLDEDGRRLGLAATVLLSLVIALCFRSVRWVVVPMAVVYATLELTEASLVESGLHMSMVSSMLWAIVAVIGIGTVVHIIVSFRESRASGLTPQGAILLAGGLLGAPVMWACLTDAAGFSSLLVSSVGPVHDFGTMMAIGSLITLLCIALLVPGLALLGSIDADPKRAWGERGIDVGLSTLSGWIERRPKTVGLVAAALTLPAIAGIARLDIETDFTKNFRAGSPIVRAYDFVESHLGGAGVWDVIVPVPEGSDPRFLGHVRRLEERLRREVVVRDAAGHESPGLTKVLSVVDAFDVLSPGRKVDAAQLESALAPLKKVMPIVATLHGRDPENHNRQFLRIMLRSAERQPSAQKRALIEQVTRISREEFPERDGLPEAQVTGFFVLLTRLIESMLRDQWLTFGVATAGIWLMMLAAFRSLSLSLVALVPNALPILVVTGLLGWTGLRINMGAAMIAAVSMGLAVDSSVHYITAFRRLRWRGFSVDEALARVHQSVGRAMVFSTLALMVGFTALCLSQFVPTIYFGVLVSLAMLGGMLGNLVILPLLLKLLEREGSFPIGSSDSKHGAVGSPVEA
jgi:uncharacterized protein